ncbi:MAG: hypothetical protein MUC88_27095 [Planctomycetes bacterium]|jgi:hypothetical protein|nr:hypothetical protein [Planctomycetota bacterium]
MARRGKQEKASKRKKVTVHPIERMYNDVGQAAGPEPYDVLDALVAEARPDLVQLKIVLCWKSGWTVDQDGQLKVGKCCKPNEVSRALAQFDLVILLNEEIWPQLTSLQKEELLFHELCHAVVVLDKNGDEKRDEAGRPCLRCRRHDIEEFHAVRERYGHDSLVGLAAGIIQAAKEPLLAGQEETVVVAAGDLQKAGAA